MGNSGFSKRYICQELLKIVLVFSVIYVVEYFLKVRGIAVFTCFISIFFTLHKIICAIKYLDRDKYHKMPKVGFMWRFRSNKGQKLSDIEIERRCSHEKNYNIGFIALLGFGFMGGKMMLLNIVVILIAYFVVYPQGYSFLDRNFGTYYKFRGECTGVITIDERNSEPSYYVSIVNYKTKEELVVDVSYEEMRNFRNGQIVDVIYGKFAKSAIFIC